MVCPHGQGEEVEAFFVQGVNSLRFCASIWQFVQKLIMEY